ncbi:protein Daple-like [Molossus nigricans]
MQSLGPQHRPSHCRTRPGEGQQLTKATQEPGSPLPAQPVSAVAVAPPQEVGGKKVFLENSSVEIFYGADSFGFALKHSLLAKLTFIWAGSRVLQIEKLQHELEGEKQTINDLQSFSEELFEEKEEMRSDMQMLRADSMRQIQVLEKEKDLLNQSMLLLQVASLGGNEAYTKDIEEENKLLQLTVTDTSRKLSKLEFEKQSLQRDMEQMQERMKQVEELEKKLHCLEKENKKLAQEFSSLTMTTTENMDALERENQDLRLKNQELSKSVDTLQIMSVQLEGLEQDNRKLRRMVKTMSIMRANMAQIEMRNQELEQEEEDLKALSRKWESLELSPQSMSAENMQLRQTLDSSSQKAQALQQEFQELQAQNLAQQQDLEAQQLANKQLECSEDNEALELEVAQLEKDKKLLEEVGKQPQQQVELEDAVLDDRAAKLSIALNQEMAHCKDVATELKELEKNNRHFTKEVTTHMKRLRTLRVDLVLEKVKSEQLNTKLDKLSQELETRGRRQELLLQDNSSHSNAHKDLLKPQVEQGEMETVLNTECGAQQQEQRTDAIAESENHRLRDELDRANFLHHLWKGDREELNTHIRKLENSLHYSQLELCHLQAQFNQLKEQHQSLDSHSELLSHLKENLEKENHHLMGQLNMLNQQNQELLEQNMKSKEQYYEEQKQSIEQLNALQRNRKKLEEKAREHNESCDPALKKKRHWIGAKAFINFIQQKKEGGREHLKSASDGTSWPLESSEPTMPSTSQPPESQLKHLEATPSCSKWAEEQDTPKVSSGKAARCKNNPFYRSNSNNKAKSTAAHPTFYKRLWCWSSPAGASSP